MDNKESYFVGFIITTSVIGILYSRGYFSRVSGWFSNRCERGKLLMRLIQNIGKKHKTTFVVNNTDESASLVYERLGEKYILWIPFNRKYVVPMSQFKVELLRDNLPPLDITQQPGIPYMVPAEQLGGHTIRIHNQETDASYDYVGINVPMYADEVLGDD